MAHRIYIVEDHPVMRQAYAGLIAREEGLELCGTSESAEEALAEGAGGQCDLLITDLSLPGIDGVELTRRVRAIHPGLPVVVISAYDEPSYVERARVAGAAAYLSKNGLAHTLAGAIRAVIEQGASVWTGGPAPGPDRPTYGSDDPAC